MSIKNALFLSAFGLLAPFAMANRIYVNNVCVGGDSCPPPVFNANPLTFGEETTDSGSVPILVNGDPFTVSWTLDNYYDAGGTQINIEPIVTYTGASPLTNTDNITFVMYQEFYDSSPGTWDGDYTETLPLFADAGGSVSAQACVGTWVAQLDCLAVKGPLVGPGAATYTDTETFNNLPYNDLVYRYEFDFTFSPGTDPGAQVGNVPEPAEALPLGIALASLAGYKLSRRRRGANRERGAATLS